MNGLGMVPGMVQGMGSSAAASGTSTLSAAKQAQLLDASQKFEGMLLEQMLKPMQHAQGSGLGGDADADEDQDGSLDTMTSYGTEALATAIAKQGGLGIARQVMRQVGALATRTEPKPEKTEMGRRSTKV